MKHFWEWQGRIFVLGNEEEAYLKLDDAINVEEPFPLFWSIRCLKMDELGYFELAITAIKKLIDLYPDEIIYVLSLLFFIIHIMLLNP
jgi:tetratricopeptide (TPR) repeat protein